jgi:hypothetical protein
VDSCTSFGGSKRFLPSLSLLKVMKQRDNAGKCARGVKALDR